MKRNHASVLDFCALALAVLVLIGCSIFEKRGTRSDPEQPGQSGQPGQPASRVPPPAAARADMLLAWAPLGLFLIGVACLAFFLWLHKPLYLCSAIACSAGAVGVLTWLHFAMPIMIAVCCAVLLVIGTGTVWFIIWLWRRLQSMESGLRVTADAYDKMERLALNVGRASSDTEPAVQCEKEALRNEQEQLGIRALVQRVRGKT